MECGCGGLGFVSSLTAWALASELSFWLLLEARLEVTAAGVVLVGRKLTGALDAARSQVSAVPGEADIAWGGGAVGVTLAGGGRSWSLRSQGAGEVAV